jgi:phage-related protein
MEMGIYSGNGALTMQQKVLAANAAIFGQTATQQGDFERTSEGLANQQRILAAQFGNIKILLGDFLLPLFTSVAQLLTTSVMPAFSNFLISVRDNGLAETLKATFTRIGEMRQDFMNAMLQALPGIIEAIVAFIPILIQNWATMVIALVNALVVAIPQLIAGAILFFTAIIDALVIIIPLLIAALVEAVPQIVDALIQTIPVLIDGAIQLFTGLITGLLEVLPVLIQAVIDLIPVVITALISMLPLMITGAIQLFLGIMLGLIEAIPQIVEALVNAIPLIIKALTDALPLIILGAIQLFLGIIAGLIKALPQIIAAIIKSIPQIVQALIDAIPLFIDAGIQLVGGIIKGIIDSIPLLIQALLNGIGQAIEAGKALLGIKSPSTVFIGVGKDVVDGMTIGIKKSSADPAKAISEMAKEMILSGEAYTSSGMLPSLVSPQTGSGGESLNGSNQIVNYYAAPNESIDAERALLQAMQRAKVITGW